MIVVESEARIHHDLLADVLNSDKRPSCLLDRLIVDFMVLDTIIIICYSLVRVPIPILCPDG